MEKSQSPKLESRASQLTAVLEILRALRPASGTLLAQITLHCQLAQVEWAQEKIRLMKMMAFTLLGFACLLCVMLFGGVLVLIVSWDTAYRLASASLLIAFYGLGAGIAWHRFQSLAARGNQVFAATREEIAADIAVIKGML